MPVVEIDVGDIGVITDVDSFRLPPEAWSFAQNIRFEHGKAKKTGGFKVVFHPPTIDPYFAIAVSSITTAFWLYAGLIKAYVTDGSSHFNITRENVANIVSILTGNPTTINVSSPHNLASGEVVIIAGVTGNTPDINGAHVATVSDAQTFTIPVNTTVAGTGGTVTNDSNYIMDPTRRWNGCVFNGLPILNNGNDPPQVWSPVVSSTKLQNLPNWPADTTARVIRAFRQNIFALDVTESSVRSPRVLRWSHTADPGDVPSTWDPTDTTADADRIELSDSEGFMLDLLKLERAAVLYKEDACYLVQYVGGETVYRVDHILPGLGMLATGCGCEYGRGKHFVATPDDIVVHTGRNPISVLDKRRRREYIKTMLDENNKARSFVVPNLSRSEVLFCHPEPGEDYPSRALVWNWETGALSDRKLPGRTTHGAVGIVNPAAPNLTFDAQTQTFDSDNRFFDERNFEAKTSLLLSCLNSDQGSALIHMDQGVKANLASITARLERTGIGIFGRDRQGRPLVDTDKVKFWSRLIPKMTSTGPVIIHTGMQDVINGPIRWSAPKTFNPATDRELPVDMTGVLPAIRIESTADIEWELQGYGMDIKIVGRR